MPLELAQMKKHFLELAMEYPLWDGAASFAKNPIALLSVIFGIALMFTLIVVSSMGIANNGPSGLASNFSARRYDSHSLHCLLDGWRCARRAANLLLDVLFDFSAYSLGNLRR